MNNIEKNKRKLLGGMLLGGSAFVAGGKEWMRPTINSIFVPAHAQMSCQAGQASSSGAISGTARAGITARTATGGDITVCASDLGFVSGTYDDQGRIADQVFNYSFQGCTGSARIGGNVNEATGVADGFFSFNLECPSGTCSGSGTWRGNNSASNQDIFVGTWNGQQDCCGNPEFVIGRDTVPFACPV